MQYRPEIDGLRALAVVPVIGFHAGLAGFSGGYSGVDVFFVISGYLITSILMREIAEGRFSILGFYERRARRILPALLTVVLLTMPFASLWLFPEDLRGYYQSVVAVTLFASNLLFWWQTGYFDAAADEKPLLHTWSLAVEEQFYILFPLLLLLMLRGGPGRMARVFIALAIASFAYSLWSAREAPSAGFYLLPARVWELMAGALCAVAERRRGARANDLLACAGLGLIVAAGVLFDAATPWPSWQAAVPVAGAALIILFARGGTVAARILSAKPLVAVGLVSYSAYLWHHPLFALARLRSLDPPGPLVMLGLVALTFALSAATWALVEKPFRTRDGFLKGQRAALRLATVSLAGVALVGAGGLTRVPGPDEVLQREVTLGVCNVDRGNCFAEPGAATRVVLWGDSFADAFLLSLGRAAEGTGVSVEARVMSSCPSLVGTVENEDERLGAAYTRACRAHGEDTHAALIADPPDLVILASAWETNLFDRRPDGAPKLLDAEDPAASPEEFVPRRLAGQARAYLAAGSRVMVVLPHPILRDFPRARKRMHRGDPDAMRVDRAPSLRAAELLLAALPPEVETLDLGGLMCPGDPCSIRADDGALLLYDGSHISTAMAGRVAREILARIGAGS